MDIDAGHRVLLATLARHDVAFVLVGGVALQAHGFTAATRTSTSRSPSTNATAPGSPRP
jgi:hypothetical protein